MQVPIVMHSSWIAELLPAEIDRLVQPEQPEWADALKLALRLAVEGSQVSGAVFQLVVLAASDHRVPIYECATEVMQVLARSSQEAREAIGTMSRSTDAKVRHNAILCLAADQPEALTDAVLSARLSDRSSRVRAKAADWIGRLNRHTLLPELLRAKSAEAHLETREVIEWAIAKLSEPAPTPQA